MRKLNTSPELNNLFVSCSPSIYVIAPRKFLADCSQGNSRLPYVFHIKSTHSIVIWTEMPKYKEALPYVRGKLVKYPPLQDIREVYLSRAILVWVLISTTFSIKLPSAFVCDGIINDQSNRCPPERKFVIMHRKE